MKRSKILAAFLGIVFLVNPSLTMAEADPQSAPFESRNGMLETLIKSGFDDIFEFPVGTSKASIVSLELDGQQNLVLKRSPVKSVVTEGKDWKRIESMDYLGKKGGASFSLAGYHFGRELFEAYKISNFAICHRLRDTQAAPGAGDFSMCMIFPRPVDEVLIALENRGVIE